MATFENFTETYSRKLAHIFTVRLLQHFAAISAIAELL